MGWMGGYQVDVESTMDIHNLYTLRTSMRIRVFHLLSRPRPVKCFEMDRGV